MVETKEMEDARKWADQIEWHLTEHEAGEHLRKLTEGTRNVIIHALLSFKHDYPTPNIKKETIAWQKKK